MLVSYLHKNDMEVYSLNGQEMKRIASGSLDSIKPFTGWGKKVMIVGRDVLLHTRKRYPPTTSENIAKAIRMDIKEIFPLKDPAFYFKIFEKTTTYSLVDIWAWDCSNYKEIRRAFPFTHVLPEDAAFMSDEPEITIFENRGLQHLIAHCKDGFLGGLSLKGLTDKGFETFLRSLGRSANGIKRIRLYINKSRLNPPEALPIVHEDQKEHPPCLKDIERLNLKVFSSTTEMPFTLNVESVVRVIIYSLIVYSISLFFTGRNYENSIKETLVRLGTLTDELSDEGPSWGLDNNSDVINKLREKWKLRASPLAVMDILAKSIPDGSYITRVTLNENRLNLSLSSKVPLDVIKDLSMAECVKSVKLKGTPSKVRKSDSYNFLLSLELNPCR